MGVAASAWAEYGGGSANKGLIAKVASALGRSSKVRSTIVVCFYSIYETIILNQYCVVKGKHWSSRGWMQ